MLDKNFFKKAVRIFTVILLIAIGVFLIAGCDSTGDLKVEIADVDLHEGEKLPELKITSNHKGSVRWQDEDAVLTNGTSKYYYIYTDSVSGAETSFEINITASAHQSSEQSQVIKEASCTEEGIKSHVCTICNESYNMESIPKAAHDYSVVEHVDGTCIQLGHSYYKCAACSEYRLNNYGEKYFDIDTAYGAHEFEKNEDGSEKVSTVIKSPTCNETGKGIVSCNICEHRKEVTIEKVAHDYSLEKHIEGDCDTYGHTEYFCIYNCGTQKMEDDGVTPYKKVDTHYGPHDYSVPVNTKGNCISTGYNEFKCSICDAFRMTEDGNDTYKESDNRFGEHIFEKGPDGLEQVSVVIDAPTCQEEGKGLVACTLCMHRKEVSINKVDHDYSAQKHTEGDCDTYGYTEYFCIYDCGAQKMEEDGLTPYKKLDEHYGPHDYSVPVNTRGTCISTGYNEFKCSICDEFRMTEDGKYTYKESDNRLGSHVYETNPDGSEKISTIIEHTSCQNSGRGLVKCSLCGSSKEVTIDIVPHDYTAEKHTEGNCQVKGYTEYFCVYACGAQKMENDGITPYKEQDSEFGPHDYSVAKYTPGTCSVKGYTEYQCSLCNEFKPAEDGSEETYKQYDEKFGEHVYETDKDGNYIITDKEIVKFANCQEEGEGYVYCIYDTSEDHSHKTLVHIPKTTHDYKETDKLGGADCSEEYYKEYHCSFSKCGSILMDEDADPSVPVRTYLGEFGPHIFENGICTICGELDTVVKQWNFGPANVDGFTTVDGYSDAVIAYLIRNKNNVEGGVEYYDLVIKPAEGYNGPTYNALSVAHIPWQEQFGASVTATYANYIKTVTVLEGITALSDYMCQGMAALETVHFPDSLSTGISVASESKLSRSTEKQVWLNKYLFWNCVNLKTITNIPENLTHIGTFCFNNCESLASFPFEQCTELKVVESESFRYCDSLTSLDLSECKNLESLGGNCFEFSKLISYIVLPHDNIDFGKLSQGVTFGSTYQGIIFVAGDGKNSTIPDQRKTEIIYFGEGKKLSDVLKRDAKNGIYYIEASEENPIFIRAFTDLKSGTDNIECNIAEQLFTNYTYTDGTLIVYSAIQVTTEKLADFFAAHDDIVRIGSYAFVNSDGLSSVTLPDTVKNIGALAFKNCKNLTEIKISTTSELEFIGAHAFADSKVTSILLPQNLNVMGVHALAKMSELEEIVYDCDEINRFLINDNTYVAYHNADPTILYYTNTTKDVTVKIGENAAIINNNAFYAASAVKNVDFSSASSLTTIEENAFAYTSIKNVDISKATLLTVVKDQAFGNCSNLKEAILNDTIQNWGNNAFGGKEVITTTTFTDTDGSVYDSFNGNDYWRLVSVPSDITEFTMNNATVQFASDAFAKAKGTLAKVTFSTSLTAIPGDLFNGFSALKEVTIPTSITYFGIRAFYGCNVEKVYYAGDVKDWCGISFYTDNPAANPLYDSLSDNKTVTSYLYLNGDRENYVTELIIPASVTQINSCAFVGANITKLIFEEGSLCTSIGGYAFYNCINLTEITVPEKMSSLGNMAFQNTTSVIKIYYNASNCADLVNNQYVFASSGANGNGIDLVIGELVEHIPAYLFYSNRTSYNPRLISIEIKGNSLKSIGYYAFYNQTNLKTAYIKDINAWYAVDFKFVNIGSSFSSSTTPYQSPLYNVTALKIWNSELGDYELTTSLTLDGDVNKFAIVNCPALTDGIFVTANANLEDYAIYGKSLCVYLALPTAPDNYATFNAKVYPSIDWCYKTEGEGEEEKQVIHIHEWVKDNDASSAPTCTLEGEDVLVCAACEAETYGIKKVTVKALGHSFGELIPEEGATCTSEGMRAHYECTRDGCTAMAINSGAEMVVVDKSSLIIEKLPHDFDKIEWLYDKNQHWYSCKDCDARSDEGTHSATLPCSCGYTGHLHSYTEDNYVAPTCKDYGYYICQAPECPNPDGKIFDRKSGFSDHSFTGNESFETEPSCTSVGIKHTECIYGCGNTTASFVLPAHTFGEDNVCTNTECNAIKAVFTYTYNDTEKTATITAVTNLGTATYIEIPYSVKYAPNGGVEEDYKVVIGSNVFSKSSSATADMTKARTNVKFIYVDAEIIPQNCFYSYTGAASLYLGEHVKTLNHYAFYNMTGIASLYMEAVAMADGSSSVYPFYRALKAGAKLYIDDSIEKIPAYLFYCGTTSSNAPKLTSVEFIGDSKLASIGAYAFYNSKLTSFVIPKSIKSIDAYAFSGCSSLTRVDIESLESWCGIYFEAITSNPLNNKGGSLYLDNSPITELVIPDTVSKIDYFAFYKCTGLTSVRIPASVTEIRSMAFSGCSGIESFIVDEGNLNYIAIGNCLIDKTTKTLIQGFNNSVIPTDKNVVTSIGDQAFYLCSGLTKILIPSNIKSIGVQAFYSCSNLAEVTLSDGLESIGDQAFAGCLFGELTIPKTVISFGDQPFYYCTSFYKVYNYSSIVLDVYSAVFAECTVRLVYNISADDRIYEEDGYRFLCYKNGDCVLLEYIGSETNLNLPTKVNGEDKNYTIGDMAFMGNDNIISVNIPSNVTSIGDSAFYQCTSLTEVTLSNGLESIAAYAFTYCGINKIIIPSSVESIGDYAFRYCNKLSEVIFESDSKLISIGKYGFANCTSLSKIIIPSSVTTMGSYAFRESTALEEVIFEKGSKLGKIDTYTFYKCTSLKQIVIPEVTSIGSYAFNNCTPTHIYYMGSAAISGVPTSGTKYYYSEAEPELNSEGTAYDGNYWYYDALGVPTVWVYTASVE